MTSGLTNERRTVGLFAGYAALVTLGSLLASDRTLAFFAKEGPSEHLSHAVLLGAVLAWSMFGARERRPRRSWPTFAMAAFLADDAGESAALKGVRARAARRAQALNRMRARE